MKALIARFGPRRMFSLMLLGAVCPFLGGCLVFEKQNVVAHYSKERDELSAVLIYEGFHVAGRDNKDLEQAKKNLEDLAVSDTEFRLGHPFLGISVRPEDPGTPKSFEVRCHDLLRNHITIKKGGFFVNRDGRLCFYQYVTVRRVQQFVKDANDLISERMLAFAQKGLALDRTHLTDDERKEWEMFDEATLRLIEKAAGAHHQWIRLEPGRISFTMVGSADFFTRVKADMLKKVVENLQDPKAADRQAAINVLVDFFSRAPLSIDQRRDQVTISFGLGGNELIRQPFSYGPVNKIDTLRDKELIAYAKTLPVPFKATTEEAIVAEFEREMGKK